MADEKPAVKVEPAAVPPAEISVEDLEAKVLALEADKAKLIEESANYKLGMLKAKGKVRDEDFVESEDEKIARIVRETVANTKLTQIDTEKDALIKKALKENKELKLALSGKIPFPTGLGSHTEAPPVQDAIVTTEQLAAFKARGWSDKDIERYKKNLRKNSR